MDIVDRAIEVAARAHRHQVRKGSDTPYISHPYSVGMMLARAGFDPEVIAAGILHDTVEDTDMTLGEVREEFGDRVAWIVEGCSEPDKSASWEERKEHTIGYLRTAPYEVRVVACADKLHNLGTVAEGYARLGDEIWGRFKRGRKEQEWYYRSLASSLCEYTPPGQAAVPFCVAFEELVEQVFGETAHNAI
ncbi:MAG: HD domain-containing protein [Chloroflexia bacterium]